MPLWRRSFCRTCHALEEISVQELLAAVELVLAGSEEQARLTATSRPGRRRPTRALGYLGGR